MSYPRLHVEASDLRIYATNVLVEHLDHYTDSLAVAAVLHRKKSVYVSTFTVAVNAITLLVPSTPTTVARTALEVHDALEAVEETFPGLASRSVTQWRERVDEAWQAVEFKPDAKVPQDRGIFGHIELLEALRRHTAVLPPTDA